MYYNFGLKLYSFFFINKNGNVWSNSIYFLVFVYICIGEIIFINIWGKKWKFRKLSLISVIEAILVFRMGYNLKKYFL